MDRARLDSDFLGLLNEHRGVLHRVCRTYASRIDDREELFQEIVYQMWRAFPGYRREAAPITWIYRIALNTAISSLRRRSRRPLDVPLEAAPDVATAPVAGAGGPGELLNRAIRSLGDVERALLMCYLDGLSYKEIGAVLGLSETNVGARLSRVRARLQQLVREAK